MKKIACIVPIFNYTKDPLLEENHWRGMQSLAEAGVDVFSVRASLDGEHHKGDCFHLTTASEVWQKESLINYAAHLLKDRYPFLAWVDSGIALSPGWSGAVREALGFYDVVQCFHKGIWLDIHGNSASSRKGYVYCYLRNRKYLDRKLYRNYPKPSVGGAWASRSNLFHKTQLYDRSLVGGGDTWALMGFLGVDTPEAIVTKHLSPAHRAHIHKWLEQIRSLKLKTGYSRGTYTHLWHATPTQRQHGTRHKILQYSQFDPLVHTRLNGGIVEWTEEAPTQMIDEVREYLVGRVHDRKKGIIHVCRGRRGIRKTSGRRVFGRMRH